MVAMLELQFCSVTDSFCPLVTTNMKAIANKELVLLGLEFEKVLSGLRIKWVSSVLDLGKVLVDMAMDSGQNLVGMETGEVYSTFKF
ncbi:hypothetical protein NC653_017444 [Populus alba x Populus x berolinensis]|uniref:Uncharacterized protein n=1 Tax=Populus alba x Populus x berolinensis TaxID=444605 RepID=A0AAD6W0I1_9ROSI|nr:hypothetical protein NC653_017444 [Populus alba x Populus x berolinensis]